MVSGLCFLVALFIGPIVQYIAPQATGPALILTAMLLIPFLKHINFHKFDEAIPGLLAMMMIPFTFNIGNGAALGYASMVCLILGGRWKKINVIQAVIIVLSILMLVVHAFVDHD